MSAPVFLAETGLAGLAPGDRYVLDGAEGRHAGVVQRRGPGERVDVSDGAGLRLRCVVERAQPGRDAQVTLLVQEIQQEPDPDVVLTLVQALAKGDRDEMAVEAATEVGADAIVPWQAERSVVVWRGERAAKSRARWLATVRTATKQARRARLPRVDVATDSRGLAERTEQVVRAGGSVVVLHEEATTALADVALPVPVETPGTTGTTGTTGTAGTAGARAPELLVVVGPEGGISEAELAAFTAAGAVAARLGPHVLRTSTAGPVAVALLAERLGRWSTPSL